MKTRHALAAMIGIAALTAGPAIADEATGQVREIIVKIETPDGPRWYTLGTDLKEIDIREGADVRFNYDEDTIDAITVEKTDNGDPPSNKSE